MNAFLNFLARRAPSAWTRYGLVLAATGLITAFRLLVRLDTAPFLLYLPVLFLLSVAVGRGPGLVGVALSALLAASFFVHPGSAWWQLTAQQWIAVVEYLLVCGAMVEVCGTLRRSIFENEAALERLQKSETNLRTIVDTVPVGIMFAEAPSGRIIGRNKRMDDIVGPSTGRSRSIEEYGEWTAFHADGRRVESRDYPLVKVIKAGAREASLQVQYERRDGSRVWIDLVAAETRDASGHATGAVVAVSDIDARKHAEAAQTTLAKELDQRRAEAEAARNAAEAANRAKSAFLANMSHELRTPLSAVIGYTELLEEEAEDLAQSTMLADLGKIKSNAKHLLSLINDVLDLSKVEASKMEVFAEDFAVEDFVRDAVATVDALARTKSNRLAVSLDAGLGTIHSDAVKLRQCVFNLLSNACKFTENGQITLSARREAAEGADWLVLAVSDTGIGMTPDQVRRLFERFTQADETTTRRFGGTGLGLALSRAFARLLGGDIGVTSTEGQGTCFTLRIPCVAPSQEPADVPLDAGPHAAEPAGADGARRDLVLVIDDEASQRELLTRFLHKQDFAVRTAGDGRSGLALARALKPRVILLDVMMPDQDGWSVLNALKSAPETAEVPVVMVSFVAEPGLSAAMGAADTIRKPIDWTRLRSVMERFRDAGGHVLVVDDDRDTRLRLRTMLEKNRWSVREAGNGAEALERVVSAPPQLILLDLTMPLMDGFAFLHRLRAIPGCANIPVVVLSARDISAAEYEQLSDAERVLKKGETSMRDLSSELRALRLHDGPRPLSETPSRLDARSGGDDQLPDARG